MKAVIAILVLFGAFILKIVAAQTTANGKN